MSQVQSKALTVQDQRELRKRLYREEKRLGKRLPNGAKPLQRLTVRHRMILQMHLSGAKNEEIAGVMEITANTVSRILNDPLAREYVNNHLRDEDHRFATMYTGALDVLQDGLRSDRFSHRLQAANMVFKKRGDFNKAEETGETAEDVIGKIYQIHANIQVNGPARIDLGGSKKDD